MRIRAAGRADVDADRRPLLVDGSVVAVFIYDTLEMKRNSLFICLRFRFASLSFFFSQKVFLFTLYQFFRLLFQQIFQILLFADVITLKIIKPR
jgi:hypothetical protein